MTPLSTPRLAAAGLLGTLGLIIATNAADGPLTLRLVGLPVALDDGVTKTVGGISIAFNCIDDEYRIVWFDRRVTDQNNVYAQRISSLGVPLGENVTIIEGENSQTDTTVTHSPIDNRYLITWKNQGDLPSGPGFNHTFGAIASATGGLLDEPIDYSNGGMEPTVAYNSIDNTFLLEARNFAGGGTPGIRGTRIAADGKLLGDPLAITADGLPAPAGQVAYNSNANQFLATWRDQVLGCLKGRIINADGSFANEPLTISTVYPDYDRAATVAFDPVNNRYFVVFSTFGGGPVHGQFLRPDMTPEGDVLALVDGSAHYAPSLDYDGVNHIYLLAWRDTDATRVSARILDAEGAPLGSEILLDEAFASDGPRLAVNSLTGGCAVVWEDDTHSPTKHDVLAQVLAVVSAADVTGDAIVDVLDLLAVLAEWGQHAGPADITGDGTVDVLDLLIVLANWT